MRTEEYKKIAKCWDFIIGPESGYANALRAARGDDYSNNGLVYSLSTEEQS